MNDDTINPRDAGGTDTEPSRRQFLRAAGTTLVGATSVAIAGCEEEAMAEDDGGEVTDTDTATSRSFETGEASIVFFYMGDSEFTATFQHATRLNTALKGYDEKVLLKHDVNPRNVLSAAAVSNADSVRTPTASNFEDEIRRLTRQGYTIDLYVYSHGYDDGSFRTSTGTHGSERLYGKSDVRNLRTIVPGNTVPLRMVYQVNCWGSRLNTAWIDVGAEAAAGSRYVNFFPHQFAAFADNWRRGNHLRTALNDANTGASRTIVHSALAAADAPATRGDQWGGCPFGATVLGNNPCARDYFVNRWNHDPNAWTTFSNRKNGQANINRASEKLIEGDPQVTNTDYY